MLEKKKRKAISINPGITLLYGAPKVGKTTVLSQLKDCLILDTENGSNMLDAYVINLNSREELLQFYKDADCEHTFKYFALDTIDKLIEWIEQSILKEYDIESINDLPYGKGFGLVRTKTINHIQKLSLLVPHLIIIGHRKTAVAVDNSNAIEPESLDVSGKLKNLIMAKCDAIGYMFRDEEEQLMVSFKPGKAIEAGGRCLHLRGKILPFNWESIYKKEK
tara:strand:+ start:1905 stop:2567 length:663 start_codon:yes stop_codon:yes gene_type:complete